MVGSTEEAKLKAILEMDGKQPLKLVDELVKRVEDLKKLSANALKIGFPKDSQRDLKESLKAFQSLSREMEALSGKGYTGGVSGLNSIKKQFRDLADALGPVKTGLKEINRTLASVRTSFAGTDALFQKSRFSGLKDNLLFGTSQGQQFQELKLLHDRLVKMPQQVNKLVQELNEALNPALKAQREATEKAAKIQESYNNRLEYTNKVLPMVQLNIMANYAAINKLVNGFKYLINYSIQYDEELHQLQAISGMTDSSLSKVRDTIESVAMATEFSSLEIAKASTVLAQAGLSATQIQRTLPAIAKLATATGTDLATSTDVITSTLNVYNMQVSEAEHVTNALTTAMNESKATISQFQTGLQYAGNITSQLGVSFEETTAAISAMTQAGIRSKSTLGTGLRAILTEFAKPSKNLITQLEKVGLSLDDVDVRAKGLSNVLKTLKNAGFGVTEALRGMQRRSATALVSLMSQVEFMDELRLKMAGSTAASKANETQMEALAKQIKNFQNVMSNAATRGLEPFIWSLSELLAVLNKLANTAAGKGILATLLTGAGLMGIRTSLTMAAAAIKSIFGSLNILGKSNYITGISKTITFISKTIASMHGKLAATGVALKALFGGFTGATMIITILYQIADAFGVFESAGEKAKAKLDELKGEAEELKTTSETIQDFQERLLRDRKRLEDSTEKDIFVRELLTRLPEANRLLDVTSASLEDVEKALRELSNISLENTINNLEKMAKAAQKATLSGIEESAENLKGGWWTHTTDIKRFRRGYSELQRIIPNTLQTNLLNYTSTPFKGDYLSDKEYTRYLTRIMSKDLSSSIINGIINDLRNYYKSNTTLTDSQKATQIESLTANDRINAAIGPALRGLAEEFRLAGQLINTKLDQGIKTEFNEDTTRILKDTQASIDSFDQSTKEIKYFLDEDIMLNQKQSEDLQAVLTDLLAQYDKLNNISEAKTLDDLKKAYGYDDSTLNKKIQNIQDTLGQTLKEEDLVKAIVDSEDKGQRNQLIIEISERINGVIEALNKAGLPLPSNISTDPGIFGSAIKVNQKLQSKAKNKSEVLRYGEATRKNIISRYNAERSKVSREIEDKVTLDLALNNINLKEKADLESATAATSKYINKLSGTGPKFDTAAASMNKFFKDLDANINKVETTFINAERALNQELAIQQGRIRGVGLAYGKNSVLNQYEQNVAQNLEDSQIPFRLANLRQKRQGYIDALDTLRGSGTYKDVTERYKAAEARYDSAVARGSWNEAREANRIMKELGNAYKKYTDEEKKLTSNVAQLDESITSLDTTLKEREALEGKGAGEQILYGMKAAGSNYFQQQKDSGFLSMAGSVGYMTAQGIDALDSNMTNMFQNILEGSQRAGDAFKEFGRSVIKTIRDVAVQMAVKQGLSALFGAFGMGTTTTDTGSNSWLFGGTGVGEFAVGGLINGPVKNRDSVPTMLMPGEYVLKKSAVDTIGRDYLDNLNANASATMNEADQYIGESKTNNSGQGSGVGGTVNVYVVGQEQQQSMTPNDVVVTITQDMIKGGQTKKLVKSIAMGTI